MYLYSKSGCCIQSLPRMYFYSVQVPCHDIAGVSEGHKESLVFSTQCRYRDMIRYICSMCIYMKVCEPVD